MIVCSQLLLIVVSTHGVLTMVIVIASLQGKAPQLDTLMAAVKAQNVPLVQLLLQRKADVNGQETKGLRSKGGVCLKYFFF